MFYKTISFFFGHTRSISYSKARDESKPCHTSNLSHSSDNTGSLNPPSHKRTPVRLFYRSWSGLLTSCLPLLYFSLLILTCSVLATLTSWLFHKHTKSSPTSVLLYLLSVSLECSSLSHGLIPHFPQVPARLRSLP